MRTVILKFFCSNIINQVKHMLKMITMKFNEVYCLEQLTKKNNLIYVGSAVVATVSVLAISILSGTPLSRKIIAISLAMPILVIVAGKLITRISTAYRDAKSHGSNLKGPTNQIPLFPVHATEETPSIVPKENKRESAFPSEQQLPDMPPLEKVVSPKVYLTEEAESQKYDPLKEVVILEVFLPPEDVPPECPVEAALCPKANVHVHVLEEAKSQENDSLKEVEILEASLPPDMQLSPADMLPPEDMPPECPVEAELKLIRQLTGNLNEMCDVVNNFRENLTANFISENKKNNLLENEKMDFNAIIIVAKKIEPKFQGLSQLTILEEKLNVCAEIFESKEFKEYIEAIKKQIFAFDNSVEGIIREFLIAPFQHLIAIKNLLNDIIKNAKSYDVKNRFELVASNIKNTLMQLNESIKTLRKTKGLIGSIKNKTEKIMERGLTSLVEDTTKSWTESTKISKGVIGSIKNKTEKIKEIGESALVSFLTID